ncbi:MAG TPA: SusD/RagB family nutrient-binding outer membrane lipoprotein, partial [Gemmatimonadales bacterium]|nr:SusD/RagB family nutrient-binding outer membrane lipoprotein [Gemmatimonadales bacterium]
MRRTTHVALACLGVLLGTAGCDTFLTGDKLSNNPNLPTLASPAQLFVGVQAGQFAFQEGTVAMMMCEWVQACSAANGRFVQQAAQYVFGEGSNIAANDGDWLLVYAGGGLVDIKNIEADVIAANDSVWLGIAQIWEAFTIGTASDMWGDIPYSQAVSGNTSPVLDNRFVILGNLQTLLSSAITNVHKGSPGPGTNDLVFHGDTAKWRKAAWTLKARYYMHTAESLGTPAYTAALAAAANGIDDPTGASDFASFHTAATSERNMWTQFQTSSGFGTDLEAGQFLVNYMKARNDPRLGQYFCKATTAAWKPKNRYLKNGAILDPNGNMEQVTAIVDTAHNFSGSVQPTWPVVVGTSTADSNVTWINRGLPYVGDDFNVPPPPPVSQFNCLPPRFAATTRIP